jgi:hypothetical protein
VLLAVAACQSSTTPNFNYTAAPGFSLAGMKTYSWAYAQVPQGFNSVTLQMIRNSMDSDLAARGFQRVDSGGDFFIGITVGSRSELQVTNWPTYPGWGWGRWGWAAPMTNTTVQQITQGSLALDVYNGQTKEAMWHGFASRQLSSNPNPELVQNAVAGLVERFVASGTPKPAKG